MRTPLVLLTTVAVTSLGACTPEMARDFNAPAGNSIDEGSFGNPTMNNIQVMSGERNAAINLSRKFASEVPSTVNFAFNSATLDSAAQAALRQQAQWIRSYSLATFRVYGHTDKVGSNNYNQSLGLRRAQTVVNYLVSQGIERSRLEAVVSFGETQPIIVTDGRERRNRRTVTEVSGFLKGRSQTLDGKYALFEYTEYVKSATENHTLSLVDEEAQAEER
ncbi:Outer membrane lipoprotein Omp16 precursor [Actibacterium lipolyticum]|uniref:Outer membrane lipoprotein Omp16 n=2 Tax=Actibacterium lipolyticum TaxID=1524263 RepID=A0A238KN09_9RHOB|nr:Outer membrane lipoprotein Omp16 precursor [Actibacterium lipolyticum]